MNLILNYLENRRKIQATIRSYIQTVAGDNSLSIPDEKKDKMEIIEEISVPAKTQFEP